MVFNPDITFQQRNNPSNLSPPNIEKLEFHAQTTYYELFPGYRRHASAISSGHCKPAVIQTTTSAIKGSLFEIAWTKIYTLKVSQCKITCICLLTTSNGYVNVCPNKPARAPQDRRIPMDFWCSSGTCLLSSS